MTKNVLPALLKFSLSLFMVLPFLLNGNAAAQTTLTLYQDLDRDGYGNKLISIVSPVPVSGYVTNARDCNDQDPKMYPGARELCDGIDRNCDGIIPAAPSLTLVATDTVACEGEIITLTALDENNEPVFVEWSTGDYDQSISLMPFETMEISAVYTAPTGCLAEDAITIRYGFFSFASLLRDVKQTLCPGQPGYLFTEVFGVEGPWVLTYTDGVQNFEHVQNSVLDTLVVFPQTTTTYKLLSVQDQHCDGFVSGSYKIDVEKPLEMLPVNDISVVGNDNCIASVKIPVTVSGTPASTVEFMIGGNAVSMPYTFGLGTTTVEIIASNRCGTIVDTVNVTVTDEQAPFFTTTQDNIVANNDPGNCGAVVNWTAPQASDYCGLADITQTAGNPSGSLFPVGVTTVTYVAVDSSGNQTTQSFTVTVNNTAPVLSNLQASPATVDVGVSVNASAQVADNNLSAVTINWGDGATTAATVSGANVSGAHVYTQSGTFNILVTATDACNAIHSVSTTVTVKEEVEEQECSVTANGWFNSPKNAYSNCKNATGKAHFNVHAKSKNGGRPEGKASLNFQAGDLKFDSRTLLTLTCSENRAVLTGTGDLNCKSGYRFMVIMVDEDRGDDDDDDNSHGGGHGKGNGHNKGKGKGHHSHGNGNGYGHGDGCGDDDESNEADRVRFKIWNSSNVLVYDNQRGSSDSANPPLIGGGSVHVKHNGNGNNNLSARMASVEDGSGFEGETKVTAFPNPFIDRLTVQFYSDVEEDVTIRLLDLSGNPVYHQKHGYSYDGVYEVELSNKPLTSKVFFVKINQGVRTELVKVGRK